MISLLQNSDEYMYGKFYLLYVRLWKCVLECENVCKTMKMCIRLWKCVQKCVKYSVKMCAKMC